MYARKRTKWECRLLFPCCTTDEPRTEGPIFQDLRWPMGRYDTSGMDTLAKLGIPAFLTGSERSLLIHVITAIVVIAMKPIERSRI